MKAVYCPCCGGRTKRNGRTSSGSQRWRCTACGASTTVRYDDTATRLDEFLGWLLSKDSQAAMPGGGRSFRRRTAEFWEVWPMPVPDGELHRVLYVDGIWVARDLMGIETLHRAELWVERQGGVGGPSPQGSVPVLAGLVDGNWRSVGTHFLSYKPEKANCILYCSLYSVSCSSSPHIWSMGSYRWLTESRVPLNG